MNNTFGLAIFMGLVYFRDLEWDYTTETLAIMGVTILVGINGLKPTIKYVILQFDFNTHSTLLTGCGKLHLLLLCIRSH
jgi:hypothetical protein